MTRLLFVAFATFSVAALAKPPKPANPEAVQPATSPLVNGCLTGAAADNEALDGNEALKPFKVLDVARIGMPRARLEGFTCMGEEKWASPRTPGWSSGPRHCYKIVDDVCKKAKCKLDPGHDMSYGVAFLVNGIAAEIDFIEVALTDTDACLVYDINYSFGPRQMLTPDGALGKALIARFGAPLRVSRPDIESDKVGGGSFDWEDHSAKTFDTRPFVDCSGGQGRTNGSITDKCKMHISSDGVLSFARQNQKDADEKAALEKQPKAAPKF
jgi:hypothetical protein